MRRSWFLAILIIFMLIPVFSVQAQGNTICILTYEDVNENGVRDAGEAPLPGISVHLAVQQNIIIETYITGVENTPYCFSNLEAGVYQLTFANSPNHKATTQNSTEIPVEGAGQRIRVEFGALAEEPLRTPEEAEAAKTEEMALSSRVGLALVGAVIAMLFMIGLGAIVVSVIY